MTWTHLQGYLNNCLWLNCLLKSTNKTWIHWEHFSIRIMFKLPIDEIRDQGWGHFLRISLILATWRYEESLMIITINRRQGCYGVNFSDSFDSASVPFLALQTPRRYIKERLKQTMTKPNHNFLNIWEHSFVSWWRCLDPMRWQVSC